MHVGGIQIIGGLFSLGLVLVLLSLYLLLFFMLLAASFWLVKRFQTGSKYQAWKLTKSKFVDRRISYVFVLFAFLNCAIYLGQRIEWMGDDNGNFEAKEYYVSGLVLDFYRSLLSRFIYPGKHAITHPLDWLQKKIYLQGIQYLPENDGERGVWLNTWFIYPYARTFLRPYNHKGTYEWCLHLMKPYLDDVWASLQSMAEGEYQDSQMYRQHYLRNFAGAAFYYSMEKSDYVIRGRDHLRRYIESPYLSRDRVFLQWLREYQKKCREDPEIKAFLKREPKIEVMLQVTVLRTISELIYRNILDHKFSCEDPLIGQYATARWRLVAYIDDVPPPIAEMNNKHAVKWLYSVAINDEVPRLLKYVLKHYCGYKRVFGEASMKDYTVTGKDPFEYEIFVIREVLYPDEIRMIEESLKE